MVAVALAVSLLTSSSMTRFGVSPGAAAALPLRPRSRRLEAALASRATSTGVRIVMR